MRVVGKLEHCMCGRSDAAEQSALETALKNNMIVEQTAFFEQEAAGETWTYVGSVSTHNHGSATAHSAHAKCLLLPKQLWGLRQMCAHPPVLFFVNVVVAVVPAAACAFGALDLRPRNPCF
eukprot:4634119-Amphidinium_carterae.1